MERLEASRAPAEEGGGPAERALEKTLRGQSEKLANTLAAQRKKKEQWKEIRAAEEEAYRVKVDNEERELREAAAALCQASTSSSRTGQTK